MGSTTEATRIAVLMGGPSAEREVSLVTGDACAAAARAAGYDVAEIDPGPDLDGAGAQLVARLAEEEPKAVLNALHGRWGEDGCVQGLLEWLGIAYSHSGVLASALAMDKHRAKTIFAAEGLRVASHRIAAPDEIAAGDPLPRPYVVKPVNEGSSVDVHIVLEGANDAPKLLSDGAYMVEAYIPGRELTVSVLDGRPLIVTEIRSKGWYDYEAKYSEGGSEHILPAEIPDAVTEAAMDAAAIAHRALGCRGVSRSDFRWDDRAPNAGPEKLIILETNTQPGMTPTSLTPEQAAACGMSFEALVDWMIKDASVRR